MTDWSAAGRKAWETRLKNQTKRTEIANKAVQSRNRPSRKAWRTEQASREAFAKWAVARGWFHVFLDDGNPRTGIVDALLIRVGRKDPDRIEVRLVQMKGGCAGFSPEERTRLLAACGKASIEPAAAYWDANSKKLGVDLLELDEEPTGS
jgi:hypothetical protein